VFENYKAFTPRTGDRRRAAGCVLHLERRGQDIHDGIAAGADDYIVKPFDEAALKAKLEKLGRG
jgi:DNA-binding response OmpR family regulator